MSNNQKVLEVISKFSMFNYLHSLIQTKISKKTLYKTFPITNAPNWSDKKEIVMIENLKSLLSVVGTKNNLN
ncbi:hypothetical protein ACFL52_05045 [Candidatus Margulisiibacteriota bacterium]